MLKKSITYINPFTEKEVTEDHFFHISKADLVEMEMAEHGVSYTTKTGETLTGMQAKLQRIIDSEDGKAILFELKDMVRRSYGKKIGDRFVKSEEIWQEFASSEAYSQLIFDLCTNAEAGAQFMSGIVPHDLEREAVAIAAQVQSNGGTTIPSESAPGDEISDKPHTGPRVLTQAEIENMDPDELKSGIATGRYKLS